MTIRKGILLMLALFGLIIGGTTLFTVRYTRDSFVSSEYQGAIDILTILARQIDGNLNNGVEHPYRILETTATVQAVQENFSYLVRDTAGMVVAPSFAAGKELPIDHVHWLTKDKGCCIARVWGYDCFVVVCPISGRPLEMVAVYDYNYMFDDVYRTLKLFVIVIASIFLVLVLLSWFWIIPALERTLDRKHRIESEIKSAHDLQQKAVTQDFPQDTWFDIHAELRAMKDVGGDIYLCGMVGRKLCFVVGDVSDKGTSAAFVMFLLSSFIRSRVQTGIALDRLMGEVNRLICDNPDYEMFCTLFMGIIDPDTLEMTYCNAGHTKTIVNDAFLDQDPQLIAGIVKEHRYHTQTLQLHPGDRLLLYTDGVTEARNESRAFFGEQRLLSWTQERPAGESCADTCGALLDTLAEFRGKARQSDDIAIMCIKI